MVLGQRVNGDASQAKFFTLPYLNVFLIKIPQSVCQNGLAVAGRKAGGERGVKGGRTQKGREERRSWEKYSSMTFHNYEISI